MTAAWMLRAACAGALLAAAALPAERACALLRLPRRWAWAVAMLGSVAVPLLALLAPGTLPVPGLLPDPERVDGPPAVSAVAAGHAGGWLGGASAGGLLAAAWAAASVPLLVAVVFSYLRLRRVRARAAEARVDGVPVRVSERGGPAVVGLLHPAIVLPRWMVDGPAAERALVLAHEREHLRAGDAWLLALSSLALAAMPWSPALWWQQRRLRLAVETDCDARVLAGGAGPREYGRVLLKAACATFPWAPSPSWAAPASHLERRIIAMSATRPAHPLRRALPAAALALLAAAAACAVSEPSRTPTAQSPDEARSPAGTLARQLPNGTEQVVVPARPNATTLGMSYGWNDLHVVMGPGHPRPRRMPSFPEVHSVAAGLSASAAGVQVGDTIVAVNGRDAREPPLFPVRAAGTPYTLRLRRSGRERDATVTFSNPKP